MQILTNVKKQSAVDYHRAVKDRICSPARVPLDGRVVVSTSGVPVGKHCSQNFPERIYFPNFPTLSNPFPDAASTCSGKGKLAGQGTCICLDGYRGQPVWNASTGRWTGACTGMLLTGCQILYDAKLL